mgnify:CR=1 FL=1
MTDVIEALDAYLSRLPLADDRRRALRARVLDSEPTDRREALQRLRAQLQDNDGGAEAEGRQSVRPARCDCMAAGSAASIGRNSPDSASSPSHS